MSISKNASLSLVFIIITNIFLTAFLLFWSELLFGKLILPHLGGSAFAWISCMTFFQIMLVFGYSWAFYLNNFVSFQKQKLIQVILFLFTIIISPLSFRPANNLDSSNHPVYWVLLTALYSLGLCFFLLSSLSPILQAWINKTKILQSPYIFFSISNLGSIIGLLAFPFILEKYFDLNIQINIFKIVFILNAMFLLLITYKLKQPINERCIEDSQVNKINLPKLSKFLYWLFLSFVPSSLLLGTTVHITTDIAPIPLLWVLPLFIYLVTFVFVFAPKPIYFPPKNIVLASFIIIIAIVIVVYCKVLFSFRLNLIPDLIGLTLISWFFHTLLAKSKPDPEYLTIYYLSLSIGGMLGGIFNSFLAPLLFKTHFEYHLLLMVSAIMPFMYIFKYFSSKNNFQILSKGVLIILIIILIPGSLLLEDAIFSHYTFLAKERSFFGTYTIFQNKTERFFMHGTTKHGSQYLQKDKSMEPTMYYDKNQSFSDLFQIYNPKRVAVIGLGAGTLACYGKIGQKWDFYELDPTVKKFALKYFSFLKNGLAKNSIVLGDARNKIHESKAIYDLIFMDAFNSDSIPVHLLTREALQIYLKHLSKDGLIVLHITNRHLNLKPIIKGLALTNSNFISIYKEGTMTSYTIIGNRNNKIVSQLLLGYGWKEIEDKGIIWTDSKSNIFNIMKINSLLNKMCERFRKFIFKTSRGTFEK